MSRRDSIINAWDVCQAVGSPLTVVSALHGWYYFKDRGSRFSAPEVRWKTWDDVVAAHPNVDGWSAAAGQLGGYWFPTAHLPTETLRKDSGAKVKFVEGVPCQVQPLGRDICASVAAPDTFVSEYRGYGPERTQIDVPACKTHAARARKRAETDARWKAQSDARRERWDRERQNLQAASDWAKRLEAEWGIESSAVSHHERLAVETNPEKLHAKLMELAGILRDYSGLSLDEVQELVRDDG